MSLYIGVFYVQILLIVSTFYEICLAYKTGNDQAPTKRTKNLIYWVYYMSYKLIDGITIQSKYSYLYGKLSNIG